MDTRKGLSHEQVDEYHREGYIVLPSFVETSVLQRIDRAVEQIVEQGLAEGNYEKQFELEPDMVNGKPVVRRIFDPFDQHQAFRDMGGDGRILDNIESLIGPDITLHHSKLNMKSARVGSVVEWHQDMAYFPHTNDDLITCLIYLDDTTQENGCLQVLPRHHTHFFSHELPDGSFAGMITEDLSNGRWGRPVPLEAPAGSLIMMHCITPHASLANRSDRSRRTLIFEYRAADAFPIYYGDMVQVVEAQYRLLRGRPARYARFGGPQPLIPQVNKYRSLYELQQRSKAKLQAAVS